MCTIVDMLMQAVNSFTNIQSAEADRKYAADVAKNEARYAEYQAKLKENAIKQAEYDAVQEKRKVLRNTAQTAGNLRLLTGSSGVALDSGSALDVLLDNAQEGVEETFAIDHDFKRTKERLQYEANSLLVDSTNQRRKAQDSRSFLEKSTPYFGSPAASTNKLLRGR